MKVKYRVRVKDDNQWFYDETETFHFKIFAIWYASNLLKSYDEVFIDKLS